MRSFFYIALAVFISSCTPKSPNIVIIYADDMGYGDLAIQNPDAKLTTPNLDQLAKEGIRFTDGHSSSGICTPSRFAMLTGQYHWRRFHDIVWPFKPSVFRKDDFTIPRMLKSMGYTTACIGKWHLGWDWDAVKNPGSEPVAISESDKRKEYLPDAFDWSKPIPGGPIDQGFDYYFGDGVINFPPYAWVENDRIISPPTERFNISGKETKEGNWEFNPGPMVKGWDPYQVLPTIAAKAVDWISQQDDKQPFFLYFPLTSPHAPIIPNDEFDGKTKAGAFGDFVHETDYLIGQVLEALDQHGFTKNTLVIFTADNGPEYYAYERIRRYKHFSTGDLRGLKRDVYEGGHRVPFIVRWPGHIEKGVVASDMMHQVDIAATLAEIVGYELEENEGLDSFNQLPLWLGTNKSESIRTSMVHNTWPDVYAIRKDNWLYLDYNTGYHTRVPQWILDEQNYPPVDTILAGLLFDLDDDLGQRTNLFSQHPEKVAEMKSLLEETKSQGRSHPPRINNH